MIEQFVQKSTAASSGAIPSNGSPSCLLTTFAPWSSQESSQTVPHVLLKHNSTLPSVLSLPPASLISPVLHAGLPVSEQKAPASRVWSQVEEVLQEGSTVHTSLKTLPVPWPKKPAAERIASAGGRGEGREGREGKRTYDRCYP